MSRIARIRRAIKAYYDWDDQPTNPMMPLVEFGPDIDAPDIVCADRERGWMGTFLGGKFFPLAPKAEDIHIEDIAHGLSMTCRYGGQCVRFYSVAEHCVHVSWRVDPKYALHGLLHDSAEAYIGDLIRPIKHQPEMIAFRQAEESIELEVAKHFGLKWTLDATNNVKTVDNRILADEVLQLHTNPKDYIDVLEQQPLGIALSGWSPIEAEKQFLARFYQLVYASRTSTAQP